MRIMAVTKNVPIERMLPVLEQQNIRLIGENRWQEAKDKLEYLPAGIEKHFIGHLQSNKATEVVRAFDCIETIDSLKLAEVVNQAAMKLNKKMPVFLQVNASHDPAKHGLLPEELIAAVEQLEQFEQLELIGLMTITAKQAPEKTRADYRRMKEWQTRFNLPELSMGMSADWQIAVAEGATIVRLGTALFGSRLSAKLPTQ